MTSVSELYQARVSSGQLAPDAAQQAVLPALDRVASALAEAAPQTKPAKSGWLSRLVGGAAPEPARPKGFIFGAASGAASPC